MLRAGGNAQRAAMLESMRFDVLACLVPLVFASVVRADAGYRLDVGASVREESLKVEPTVVGPAGKTVRYEITVRRDGQAGASNSSQAGSARIDDSGHAKLASSAVSVRPGESYDVNVRLFADGRVVAEERVKQP
jgi:hypothetical protein